MAAPGITIRQMIVSLGGSPEPLRLSIATYRPEKVIFLASHDSAMLAGKVLEALDYKPKVEFEITEDPNSLLECYRKAKLCVDRTNRGGWLPEEIMVDYTGGTKVMTAALLLASIEKRFHFNYVGGDQRDKNGVGIVVGGHERFFAEMSPWAIFAEEERRQIVTLFNRRRYAAVVEIIDALAQKTIPAQIGGYLQFVRQAAIAFMRWDQFEIKSALEEIHKANDLLAAHIRFFPASDLEDFRQHLDCLEKCLQAILSQTRGLKEPHRVLVDDLLNNARRKMADKRNDDAAARIYRALELYGQICFRELTGCTNDKVQPGMVPQELREEFVSKYRDPASDLLKLPLQATFRFLKCNGHEAGKRFYSYLKEIKNIQSNRNESILAHGLNPVSDKAVESIFKTVAEFIEFKEIYDFPRLP